MTPNTLLAHFRLLSKLGEGGMGIVWRALDTTLDREVAIKILPEAFEQHPDRLERFEREAKVLASLHHPNIAILHGLHKHEDKRFLVMELVDGEDLSERLARGPLETTEALKLAAQIARALEAAHERNVIHRDLKPANIVLTSSGEAKVLDFGLAKVLDPERDSNETSAATVTTGGTTAGAILGTAAYMSPEQARGKPTDRRTDIWSFGCILHECLTGISEFRGETMSDSIGAILHKSPDWNVLPADLPLSIRWLLRRCLTKDRDNRLHDIADARIELEQAIVDPQAAGAPAPVTTDTGARRPWLWPALAASLMLLAGVVAWALKPTPVAERPVVSLSVELPVPQDNLDFTISPDGRTIVYRAADEKKHEGEAPKSRLWVRRLDSFVPTPLAGTEEANGPTFSPDGKMVAYVVDHEGGGQHQADLRVVGLDGRPPLTVTTGATDHSRPAWLSADEIVYVDHKNEKRLLAISRGGGDPRTFAELPEETTFSSFSFGVAGGWVMSNGFAAGRPVLTLIDPADGTEHELMRDASRARLLEDGRLLFVRAATLLVAQVDLDASPPRLVGDVQTVMGSGSDPDDRFQGLEVSDAGHLAFVTGLGPNESRRLMTVGRDGSVEPLIETKGSYAIPGNFSPDGRRLAVTTNSDETLASLWVVELDTGAKRPMAPDEALTVPGCWVSNDRIVFSSWKGPSDGKLMVREMRRNAEPTLLFDNWPANVKLRGARIAFDGTNLAFDVDDGAEANMDIWIQPLDGSEEPRPLVATQASEMRPSFSPDGTLLAYSSNESGRPEVYVRAHTGSEGTEARAFKVSRTGGSAPMWSADGKELFFFDRTNDRLLGARVEPGDPPRASEPREVIADLAALRPGRLFGEPELVPMPDGERFVFVQNPEAETKVERIEVVLNWAEQLER